MSTATTLITADEFAAMSFDRPVELVRGEVVEMTNPGGAHGRICVNVAVVIELWTRSGGTGFIAVSNDSGVLVETDPDTIRGPDVLVIRADRLPGGCVPQKHFTVPPELAIEVKSPTDRWADVLTKVGQFLSAGVLEVWVIDPDHQAVHLYRQDDEPLIMHQTEELSSHVLAGFRCPVADLFQGVHA